jgi:predicted nucleic acid-binding protein
MILIDANILIYAHVPTLPHHEAARRWLAWSRVEEWLALPSVWIPQPTESHSQILGELLRRVVDRPTLIPDAHLAALAIEHNLILCSTDEDFARFPQVRWLNPLQQV